jgi:inner membrane protein
MATPLGHSLMGAAIGVACCVDGHIRGGIVLGAVAAMAADLDFIPGLLLGAHSRFHHAQSHSLAFAILAAGFAALVARDARLRWGLLIGLAYASHLALDMLTLDDSPPQGIPLFWPWSSTVLQSPVTFLPNVLHGNGAALSAHNFGIAAREVLLLGPLLAGTLAVARRSRSGSTA